MHILPIHIWPHTYTPNTNMMISPLTPTPNSQYSQYKKRNASAGGPKGHVLTSEYIQKRPSIWQKRPKRDLVYGKRDLKGTSSPVNTFHITPHSSEYIHLTPHSQYENVIQPLTPNMKMYENEEEKYRCWRA